jgi:hypothetical protein
LEGMILQVRLGTKSIVVHAILWHLFRPWNLDLS